MPPTTKTPPRTAADASVPAQRPEHPTPAWVCVCGFHTPDDKDAVMHSLVPGHWLDWKATP